MKSALLSVILLTLVLTSCQKNQQDKGHLITKNRIGALTKNVQVRQLDSVFAKDSVVNKNTTKRFSNGNEIVVFNKKGHELLRLQPMKKFDSTSTIANIEVLDTVYKTKKGLGKGSSFKTLKANYKISRIENTLGAAVVFLDEINAYVSFSKKDILKPVSMGTQIKTSQIKKDAKIKHFWLGWE